MGKDDLEAECIDAVGRYTDEAARMMVDAFNQGYALGLKHGEKVFNEGDK